MKKILCFLGILFTVGGMAVALPLSMSGQKEADFYFEFLRATMQHFSDGQQLCRSYTKLLPRSPDNKYLRRQLLLCALEQQDMARAASYAAYIEQGENDGEDLAVYGFYKWRTGDLAAAQDYYEQALEKSGDDSSIFTQYLLLLSSIDVDRAAQKLQERKAQYPDQAAVLDYETGNLYRRSKDIPTALKYYQSATHTNPEYPEPYLARAEIFAEFSQLFLLLRELETLDKMEYQNPAVYATLGTVYSLVKDTPRAHTYFLKAKALDKGNHAAGKFLAQAAEQAGDFKQAAQYLQEVNGYESSAELQLQVSFYQQQAGESAVALQTLQRAYTRFEKNVEIGYFYGLLLHDEGQYRQAARVLEGVLKSNPNYAQARLAYAFTLESLKKYKQMEQQVHLLLAQNPDNAAAYNLLGYSLADRNVRLPQAQEYITKALALNAQDLSFQDSLAWLYYRQGKYDQARSVLEKLPAQFVKDNPEVSYHLGMTYSALGEEEKAQFYLQQASAILPKLGK